MDENNIAIQITGLKKKYRLGVIGGGTLQGDIQSWLAKKKGKEDPNTKIGQKIHEKNETFMALSGIDLTVYKGERLGIIGHNGAGKSTLLKLLSRVTAPTEGKICIDGRIASMLEVGTGFNPELTGRENVYLNGAILGMTKEEVDSKIDQIVEFSECAQFIDTPVKRYSSGMYVKLAFAVAAHLDSEILVMDEVLAVGDMKFQQKCLGKMSDVSLSDGKTVLYVSHNMNTIRQLCDRCIVLEHGRKIFDGNVEEAIAIYADADNKIDVVYDYTNQVRMPVIEIAIQALYIRRLKIIGKTVAKYINEKYLYFNMDCECRQKINDVIMRVEITTISGMAVCSTVSKLKMDFCENIQYTIKAKVDISMLATGEYKTILSLFCVNEYGTKQEIDAVNPAFKFSVERDQGFEWDTRYLGHIRLNDTEIIEEINR